MHSFFPDWAVWTIIAFGLGVGVLMAFATDRLFRWNRRIILWQLKQLRRPRARTFARIYGWVLIVLAALALALAILLSAMKG